MKKISCTLVLSLCTLRAFAAADVAESPVNAAPAPAMPATIELKTKSAFALEESARSPFWPIGWRPTKAVANGAVEQVSSDVQASSFLVSSITVDTTGRYAIINGKVMNEGQVFGLQMGNQTYQITVKAIEDGQVILQRRDQQIAVPLRRR